jgi:hypothetical protein
MLEIKLVGAGKTEIKTKVKKKGKKGRAIKNCKTKKTTKGE